MAYLQDGDIVRLCAETGTLVTTADLSGRKPAQMREGQEGVGRELFAMFRQLADGAEQGACAMMATAGL